MALGDGIPVRMEESAGTIHYVDKDAGGASDSGPGTSLAAPWATIDHAVQTLLPGERCYVKKAATAYAEGTITCTRGGSAGLPITLEALDSANPPVIQGKQVWEGSGASYWRFRNLVFDGASTVGNNNLFKMTDIGADHHGTDAAHDIEFYGCEAKNALGSGAGWLTSGDDTHNIQWWNCLGHDNDPLTTTHGWYLDGGHHLYLMNCIARDNGGYGFHIYHGDEQLVHHVWFFNCLSISQDGRAGNIVRYDGPTDDNTLVQHDIYWYNCISAFNTQGNTGDRVGWRFIANPITSWAGYTANTLTNCVSYGNPDGDIDGVANMWTTSGMITGTDPLFTDYASYDYHLLSGVDARDEPTRLKQNTLEGGSNGTTISAANSGGGSGDAFNTVSVGSGNTFTFDNTSGRITQTLGAKWTFGGTTSGQALWTGLGALTAKTWFRTTIAVSAIPTVGNWFGLLQWNTAASARCAAIGLRTDGLIQVYDAAGTAQSASTSAVALTPGSLYRLEVAVTPGVGGTGTVEWWLYNSATAIVRNFVDHKATSGLTLAASLDQFQIGVASTAANVAGLSGWYDDLAVSTVDQLGPRGGAAFTPNALLAAGDVSNTPIIDYAGTTRLAADIGPFAYTADDPAGTFTQAKPVGSSYYYS